MNSERMEQMQAQDAALGEDSNLQLWPDVYTQRRELLVLIQDYEETIADRNRLVRELDVLLNSEAGAAPQASLCDIVGQLGLLTKQLSGLLEPLSGGSLHLYDIVLRLQQVRTMQENMALAATMGRGEQL